MDDFERTLQMVERLPTPEASCLLSLLDRLGGTEGRAAAWPVNGRSPIATLWYREAAPHVARIAHQLRLRVEGGDSKPVFLLGRNGPLTPEDVQALTAKLEAKLAPPGTFDYERIVQDLLRAAKAGVAKVLPAEIAAKLDSIDARAMPPAGSPMREFAFFTVPADGGGYTISFANANTFTDAHKALWAPLSPWKGRLTRDYEFNCAVWSMHEFGHALTGIRGLEGEMPGWKGEFAASLLQLSFLSAAARAASGFRPAFALESALWVEDLGRFQGQKVSENIREGLARWLTSAANEDPVDMNSQSFMGAHILPYFYLLSGVAIAGFNPAADFSALSGGAKAAGAQPAPARAAAVGPPRSAGLSGAAAAPAARAVATSPAPAPALASLPAPVRLETAPPAPQPPSHYTAPSARNCPTCGRTMFSATCGWCGTGSGASAALGGSSLLDGAAALGGMPATSPLSSAGPSYLAPDLGGDPREELGGEEKPCPTCGRPINPVIGECPFCS